MSGFIRFAGLQYAYPENGAFLLDIPGLSFAQGVCAAVTGPVGSGKTTLGKLAAGLLRPTRGSVCIGGEDIAKWPLGKIGRRVGYLFQEPARQIFAPTVLEEIAFPLTLRGMDAAEAETLARDMLIRFEMEELAGAVTYTLSRGEQQRLAIAAMLVHEPGFLVLDEPTTGLDARRREILGDMLKQLLAQGVGILLISHDADFVQAHATVIRCIEGGRIV
ncbi:MAG: energy-coupling factor ABC transporter ATP-binding protein [Clostridiales bacterium]|nr:energy-coupling factor ABC transporter ATP-binding protein [Clostridiales bacterium]